MMLGRFSDVLQSAADVLAPPPSRLEDFEYHWKMVLNFYQAYDERSKLRAEDTRVPHHLHHMLQLIVDEEGEQAPGALGPCLEAVLRRRVPLLDALAALAAADRPSGARAVALALAAALLRRTRQPCLHSAHVRRPLQRMLGGAARASPTEREEAELLLALCGRVRREPGLAELFTSSGADDAGAPVPEAVRRLLPAPRRAPPPRNPLFAVELAPSALRVAIVRAADEDDDTASCRSQRTVCEEHDKFLLVDLLLAYLDSADNQVVLRACEGIMIVSSLPDDDIAHLVTSSPLCERVVALLLRKYRAVPEDLDPADVDQLNITWAYVSPEFCEQTTGRFPGRRQLTAFFSWLDYCDTLTKECHPAIGAHLARAFRSHFLEPAADELRGPGHPSARRALRATALLAKCLRQLDAPELLNEFSTWLVGEGALAEWPLLLALVDNCLRADHDLTLETLRFFEVIIEKGTEHSMDRLVLSRVCGRAYYAPGALPLQDERDMLNDLSFARERERNREALQQLRHEQHVSAHVGEMLGAPAAPPAAPELQRAINSFLLLLPRAVLSDPLGAGYEHYVHDAQRHYQLWLDVTSSYAWRAPDTASSTHSYDSRPEADLPDARAAAPQPDADGAFSQTLVRRSGDAPAPDEEFDEGPFLRMLFTLLGSMPEQPYQVNLHLTAILSKLALLPHPALHEYLLEPELAVAPATRTLHRALRAVARRLAAELPRVRHLRAALRSTRLQLMSEDPAYDERGEHNQLVETLIVVEEFCKELAAIIFVKYQHQQLQQQQQQQQLELAEHR